MKPRTCTSLFGYWILLQDGNLNTLKWKGGILYIYTEGIKFPMHLKNSTITFAREIKLLWEQTKSEILPIFKIEKCYY